jgi:hypothetical protein
MVGNSAICALRVGEWDWAAALLEEWLSIEATASGWAEFYVDRAILRALRGEDPGSDIEQAGTLRASITDPQFESYELLARAWAAFAEDDLVTARDRAERAARITDYFVPLALPLAVRAALWAGDPREATAVVDAFQSAGFWGAALDVDRTTARAGAAALEGRGGEALAAYREALRGYRQLGLAFDEAAAVVDMATLLPRPERDSPEVRSAVEQARALLTRLGARPFLARLDAASDRDSVGGDRPGGVPAPDASRPVGAPPAP